MKAFIRELVLLACILIAFASASQAGPVSNSTLMPNDGEIGDAKGKRITPNTPLGTLVHIVDHAARVDCKPPILAPDGHHLTLAEWHTARGTAVLDCHPEGTKVDLSYSGLIPNGVYTIWLGILDPALGPEPGFPATWIACGALGTPDGTKNIFKASATGQGQISAVHPVGKLSWWGEKVVGCLLNEPMVALVCAYHVDHKTYGPTPGPECTWAGQAMWRFDTSELKIGREVAILRHLQDGQEYTTPLPQLLQHGKKLFEANWTLQEGGGRPHTKGTGAPVSDPEEPLVFPHNFNRLSAPDANSCAGCHNAPFGISGGAGDFVANVFVLAQRFDFLTFDSTNKIPTKSAVDERGQPVTVLTAANSRATLGLFGSGFIEMLARQMTADLQALRDATPSPGTNALNSKNVSFGTLVRRADGSWDTSKVEGIAATSLGTGTNGMTPPSLILRPFHQAGRVVSVREFSNNAFNHHHGIQTTERFGMDKDADGDGYANEMTRADVTAASIFQATMAVPGRVIPNDPEIEQAILVGETKFQQIGCAVCHVPSLPLENDGHVFVEPNPFNPAGNLRPGDAPPLSVDLTSEELPPPRLRRNSQGAVYVPAFTDLKLHDITSGPDDPNREPLDMQQPNGSDNFFGGNGKFVTRKLWDVGNKPNHYHHGQYTTLRESIAAHAGEALASREAYTALSSYEQSSIIEFLKSLQILPPGTPHLIVDDHNRAKVWPPNRLTLVRRVAGGITISWQGGTGLNPQPRIYQLQRCTDLGLGNWENVGEALLQTSYNYSPRGPVEFYRVILLAQ